MSPLKIDDQLRGYYRNLPSDPSSSVLRVSSGIEGRRSARDWHPLRLAGGGLVAAAVALVIALVGLPVALAPAGGPDARSSSNHIGAATTSPASGRSIAASSPSSQPSWNEIANGSGAGASWSPDGSYLVAWSESAAGSTQNLRLLDRTGKLVRQLEGSRIVWVDRDSFLLAQGGSFSLGSVHSSNLTPSAASLSDTALASGAGAVALANIDPAAPSKSTFVVWTVAGASSAIVGEPQAWSPDGEKLAVWHPLSSGEPAVGSQTTGWIEVIDRRSLRAVATSKSIALAPQPTRFDPSGRYLVESGIGVAAFAVLDTQSGKTTQLPSLAGLPVWNDKDQLIVAGADGGLTTYSIDGAATSTLPSVGDQVAASADGSTAVVYYSQDYVSKPRPVTIVRKDGTVAVGVPGGLEANPQISPDGTQAVVICLVDHGSPTEHTVAVLLATS